MNVEFGLPFVQIFSRLKQQGLGIYQSIPGTGLLVHVCYLYWTMRQKGNTTINTLKIKIKNLCDIQTEAKPLNSRTAHSEQ